MLEVVFQWPMHLQLAFQRDQRKALEAIFTETTNDADRRVRVTKSQKIIDAVCTFLSAQHEM